MSTKKLRTEVDPHGPDSSPQLLKTRIIHIWVGVTSDIPYVADLLVP